MFKNWNHQKSAIKLENRVQVDNWWEYNDCFETFYTYKHPHTQREWRNALGFSRDVWNLTIERELSRVMLANTSNDGSTLRLCKRLTNERCPWNFINDRNAPTAWYLMVTSASMSVCERALIKTDAPCPMTHIRAVWYVTMLPGSTSRVDFIDPALSAFHFALASFSSPSDYRVSY